MKQFYKAIYNQFSSVSTGAHKAIYTKVNGRMYPEKAPSNVTFPYIVYSVAGQTHEWQFKSDFERMHVNFTLYSSSALINQVSTMYDSLIACYDDAVLDTTGYAKGLMIRQFVSPNIEFALDTPANNSVWQKIVDYECLLEKTT